MPLMDSSTTMAVNTVIADKPCSKVEKALA